MGQKPQRYRQSRTLLTTQNNHRFICVTGIIYPTYWIMFGTKKAQILNAAWKLENITPNVRKKPCIVRNAMYTYNTCQLRADRAKSAVNARKART